MEDKQAEELPVLGQEELEAIKEPDIITNQIALLEAQCHEMKPNLGAIAEYNKKVSISYIIYRYGQGKIRTNYSSVEKLGPS